MENKPMKILIIEDDVKDCEAFIKCAKERNDIEIVAITDSDVEGLKLVKSKRPEGIVLDLELNNSYNGSIDSLDFLSDLKRLNLSYEPIVIVTTHVNSKRTYDILHRNGVDLILYKDNPKYSSEHVLNNFINLRKVDFNYKMPSVEETIENEEKRISNLINDELELIGVTSKLKGRDYIHDAILYLIQDDSNKINVIQYLVNKYKKSSTTINNGIQNAIIYAWRITPPDDLIKYYTARINLDTGIPTPMEFIYYYVNITTEEYPLGVYHPHANLHHIKKENIGLFARKNCR